MWLAHYNIYIAGGFWRGRCVSVGDIFSAMRRSRRIPEHNVSMQGLRAIGFPVHWRDIYGFVLGWLVSILRQR